MKFLTKIIDKIKTELFFDPGLGGAIIILSVFVIIYFQINFNRQNFDLRKYTERVTLINLEFEKFYTSDFYNINRRLDRIIFDVDYEYQNRIYQNHTVLYWEYTSPKFEKILDEKKFENLVVKCNKSNPEQIMVYLDK